MNHLLRGKFWLFVVVSLLFWNNALAQEVKMQIISPKNLKGRRAILLTREKGFASIVHSLKLTSDTVALQMNQDLLPDLYQLNVSQIKGSLFFFLEPGTQIILDTTDVTRSVVKKSRSDQDWHLYHDFIQIPSDKKLSAFSAGEARARKMRNTDSLSYWSDQRALEYRELLSKTSDFISSNPKSFVSLYLLNDKWYAFSSQGIFEKLDPSLSHHRLYRALREKNRASAKVQKLPELK